MTGLFPVWGLSIMSFLCRQKHASAAMKSFLRWSLFGETGSLNEPVNYGAFVLCLNRGGYSFISA